MKTRGGSDKTGIKYRPGKKSLIIEKPFIMAVMLKRMDELLGIPLFSAIIQE